MSDIPRTMVITGATSGLGLAIVEKFLAEQYHIWILGRKQKRLDDVIKKLHRKHPEAVLHGVIVDLEDVSAIRQAVATLKDQLLVLDLLLCNAAIYSTNKSISSDFECDPVFQTNYLGHFLLVHLLLPLVPSHGQIGFVTCGLVHSKEHWVRQSGIPWCGDVSFEQLWGGEHSVPMRYALSKYCLALFAHRLARWLQDQQFSSVYNPIAVWCFDSGLLVGTSLQLEMPWYRRWSMQLLDQMMDGVSTPIDAACVVVEMVNNAQEGEVSLDCTFFEQNGLSTIHFREQGSLIEQLWQRSVTLTHIDI